MERKIWNENGKGDEKGESGVRGEVMLREGEKRENEERSKEEKS